MPADEDCTFSIVVQQEDCNSDGTNENSVRVAVTCVSTSRFDTTSHF